MSNYKDQRDRAYQLLRRSLIMGQFQPGGRLRETEWAARLRVNRAAIREACGRLCTEGLVTEGGGHGYFAAQPDADDVQDLREIRTWFAALAAERLCRPGRNRSEAVRRLRRACDELEWILEKDYPTLWNEAELRFYEALITAAKSRHLARLYRCVPPLESRWALGEPAVWKRDAEAILADRKAAVAAIERGDAAEALRLLHTHRATGSAQEIGSLPTKSRNRAKDTCPDANPRGTKRGN